MELEYVDSVPKRKLVGKMGRVQGIVMAFVNAERAYARIKSNTVGYTSDYTLAKCLNQAAKSLKVNVIAYTRDGYTYLVNKTFADEEVPC